MQAAQDLKGVTSWAEERERSTSAGARSQSVGGAEQREWLSHFRRVCEGRRGPNKSPDRSGLTQAATKRTKYEWRWALKLKLKDDRATR